MRVFRGVAVAVLTGWLVAWSLPAAATDEIDYGQFKHLLQQGQVTDVTIGPHAITGIWQDGLHRRPFATVPVQDPRLVDQLMDKGVPFRGQTASVWPTLGLWLLPLAFLLLLWGLRTPQQGGRPSGNLMGFGQTKARRYEPDKATRVTFSDVAGVPEAKAELQETVEFLREPERFTALGGRMPKGVLLVGPPGTGKTLLAKAVAGEAGVPFFSLSGSEFVELFVGVGASRVRDLFHQAREKAPCLIFIDELDAIGKARAANPLAMNDEREHTLNQLLAEMDGFDPSQGVLVLASTNRPETLDAALLRPGRFDRQVVVNRPDLAGREQILQVHAAKVKLAEGVDLRRLARRTVGLAGAELANIVNEAALLAARERRPAVTAADLDRALERVVAGLERPHLLISEEERLRVSLHEAGHALVACLVKHADPVERVSLVPRGAAALGHTWQVPERDQYLQTRSQLLDRVAVLLGGRAAEELALGEPSTGAGDDLQRATALLRQMVCHAGLSVELGPQAFPNQDSGMFVRGGLPVSEATAQRIDREVQDTLESVYARVRGLLAEHVGTLADVAKVLREEEEIDGERLRALAAGARPWRQAA